MGPTTGESAPPRVQYGPKDWQWLAPEVASMLLTMFRERRPEMFGAYLAEILTGIRPRAGRGAS